MCDCLFSCPKSLSSSSFCYPTSTRVTCPSRVALKLWEMCSHMQLAGRLQVRHSVPVGEKRVVVLFNLKGSTWVKGQLALGWTNSSAWVGTHPSKMSLMLGSALATDFWWKSAKTQPRLMKSGNSMLSPSAYTLSSGSYLWDRGVSVDPHPQWCCWY